MGRAAHQRVDAVQVAQGAADQQWRHRAFAERQVRARLCLEEQHGHLRVAILACRIERRDTTHVGRVRLVASLEAAADLVDAPQRRALCECPVGARAGLRHHARSLARPGSVAKWPRRDAAAQNPGATGRSRGENILGFGPNYIGTGTDFVRKSCGAWCAERTPHAFGGARLRAEGACFPFIKSLPRFILLRRKLLCVWDCPSLLSVRSPGKGGGASHTRSAPRACGASHTLRSTRLLLVAMVLLTDNLAVPQHAYAQRRVRAQWPALREWQP